MLDAEASAQFRSDLNLYPVLLATIVSEHHLLRNVPEGGQRTSAIESGGQSDCRNPSTRDCLRGLHPSPLNGSNQLLDRPFDPFRSRPESEQPPSLKVEGEVCGKHPHAGHKRSIARKTETVVPE